MKVLMISSDRNILQAGSPARERMVEYSSLVEELSIIVFTRKRDSDPKAIFYGRINERLRIYPTESFGKVFYIYDAVRLGLKVLRRDSGDVLISSQDPFEIGLAGYILKKFCGGKLQLQVHTDFMNLFFAGESAKNRVRVFLARLLLPRADCVRVVSERIKMSLAPLRLKAVPVVVPIYVDIQDIKKKEARFNLREKYAQFDFIALMLSRLTREKNIELAIKAMAEVVRTHPRAGLIIVGDGPELKELKSLAQKEGMGGNVIFKPWTDDVYSYYKGADVFLVTSNYEGYGRTMIEALASGCPVVTTDVGIAREVVREGYNGMIIPIGARRKLREALTTLAKDPTVRRKLRAGAEAFGGDFPSKAEYLRKFKETLQCLQ
jgi:glycosyltransferase involved in cell wall biosynthesis